MLPLTTTSADVDRPTPSADYDEPATLVRLFTAMPGHLSTPGGIGLVAAGSQEIVDALWLCNITDPALRPGDVVELANGDRYRVMWARRRSGVGLDHQVAGVNAVAGGVAA